TVVQSIVARVASFMWATQETKAPWLRKPSGVGICAAADTRAPWVSFDVVSVSVSAASDGSSVSGASVSGASVSGASVSGASLSSSSVFEAGVSALGTRSEAGWPWGAAANTTPADIASTTRATPRARKRRTRSDNGGTSGRVLPVMNDNDRHRRGVRGTSVLGRPDHGGRANAPCPSTRARWRPFHDPSCRVYAGG